MYYSNGNYEAFARPLKPEGVDCKSAYLVGGGLASLAAACFLIRDGQMAGNKIHILEEMGIPGGACDGIKDPTKGYIIRGGREMENHFECLWDLFRSIPSLEVPNASVLDEFYWLNKKDPNYSLCRATYEQGKDAHTDKKFTLSDKASTEIIKLFLSKEEDLADKTIDDVFDDEFYKSNFWLYWQTMFAFEKWHSAIEMRRYIQRFIHHIGGLPDLSALKFTKYNQYESLILPMIKHLEENGVIFQYNTTVKNVLFDIKDNKKTATKILIEENGKESSISLTEDDLILITNGSCTENTTLGDFDNPPVLNKQDGACWALWKAIAAQDEVFGHPEKFCSDLHATSWESATITLKNDRLLPYIEAICKRDCHSGNVVTGGIVTARDSSWLCSWTINRQPHFKVQKDNEVVIWFYGLNIDKEGDFIKKPMNTCSGYELVQEWLYHIGVSTKDIPEFAKEVDCIPCMLPYITSFFMPRKAGDRPNVVPEGCINAAFIGQFAESPRGCVFTTEYSVRTAMEAVYTLLNVDRAVPEVYDSCYDIRYLLDATAKMMDGRKITDIKLPFGIDFLEKKAIKKLEKTIIGELLERYKLID
ncbi:MAG: oleate hydratase [Coprobacillus sp.]